MHSATDGLNYEIIFVIFRTGSLLDLLKLNGFSSSSYCQGIQIVHEFLVFSTLLISWPVSSHSLSVSMDAIIMHSDRD